jgi:multicomponent Na+:H+ antiporter subunit G
MKIEVLSAIFLLLGAGFMFVAALGLVRFPDLFTRMHAASKAGSLGLGCILLGVAVAYPAPIVIAKCIMVLLFIFLTTPIAAHMIGRAAYLLKVPFWKGTVADELKGRYSEDRKTLRSEARAQGKTSAARLK